MSMSPFKPSASSHRLFPWSLWWKVLSVILGLGAGRPLSAAPLQTRTFSLQAGWNAVYLEVTPTNPLPAEVFRNLPLESAWSYSERQSAVDFIQDSSEPLWNRERWSYFVPTNRPEAQFNRLGMVLGHRPYLIKVTNAATWTVTGTPGLVPLTWVPNAYNLRGLPVDPVSPPTFQTFFRASTAHYTAATAQLQPMYRLNAGGQWSLVTPSTVTRSGEAYWIYCKGASGFQGPTEVQYDGGDNLDFADVLDQERISILNRGTTPLTCTVQDLLASGSTPLLYARFDPAAGFVWTPLPSQLTLPAGAGTNIPLRLAIRRSAINGPVFEGLLQFKDSVGTRVQLPVRATRLVSGPGGAGKSLADDARANAGLWIGSAQVTAVSEAHSGILVTNGTLSLSVTNENGEVLSGVPISILRSNINLTPTPVKTPAQLRLLVHVDGNGAARLLKEVIQVWQPGEPTVDTNGNNTMGRGRHVLLTDDKSVGNYQGVRLRDGELVGRRFSTVAYDFLAPHPASNYLAMSGVFAINSGIAVTFSLPAAAPTNPFRHKYHPDHKNPDQSFAVVRSLDLQFAPGSPESPPDYGYNQLSGLYTEVVAGLHRTNIVATGTFNLRRVSSTAVLDR